jgi:hypothetical protein
MIFIVGLVAIYGHATYYAWWRPLNINMSSSWEEIDAAFYMSCDNKP